MDYFFEKRDNMLVSPQATVPEEYGIGLAAVNNGRMQNQGIEFEIHGHIKEQSLQDDTQA